MECVEQSRQAASLDLLLASNQGYLANYQQSPLMQLINSPKMAAAQKRNKLLDCIQIFSDYFQKTVLLRNALCEDKKFIPVAQIHCHEEFEHNLSLMRDRQFRPPVWDPVLEATSAWFAWKMLTMDNADKTVLIHLVLETSANVFFSAAHRVMQAYKETDYFHIHAEVDGDHEQMGTQLLKDLTPERYERLLLVQQQGWDVLNAACKQIAILSDEAAN